MYVIRYKYYWILDEFECHFQGQKLSNEYSQNSVNLQYKMLVRLVNGTNDSSTKRLMFQALIFVIKSCKKFCKNPFNLLYTFFYKITKMKIKSFECSKSIRNYETKILGTSDAWSTSRLSHWPREPVYYIVDCRISSTTIRHQRLNKSEIFLFSWSQLKIW